MKPMQGNSMGKLCFLTFVLENKKISFSFLLAFFFVVSLYMHTVCVCAEMTGHTLDLPHQTLPVFKKKIEKNWATGEQGYKVARWGKETKREREREHIEKRLIHETRFFLSLFFLRQSGWVCVQISKRQTKQLWQTVMGTLHLQSVFGLTQLLRSFGLCS